jgi:dihydropyrimidinase
MLDIIIQGGEVVTPQGVIQCDVAIAGETIAAIAAPGALPAQSAGQVIDASGRIVMPGGIDPHVHLHHVWIKPDGTTLTTAGPEQVGRAALYGGTTTFIDFAYWRDGVSALEAIEARDQDFVGKSPCDWAYHIMLHSEPPPEFAGQLAEAIEAGYPTLKIFTTNILPSRTGRMIDFGDIWEAFQVLAKSGGLGVIHAEDNDIVMHMYAKLIREGRVSFEHLAEIHNRLSEDLSFRRVLRLAESVPDTALYMMHVSAATGVAAIAEARRKGLPIYGETLHQYLLYSADDYKRPNGQIYHTYPSLKSVEDQRALCVTERRVVRSIASPRMSFAARSRIRPSAAASTTPPAAIQESSRALVSCILRWLCGADTRYRDMSIWSPAMPRGLWGSIRGRGQSPQAATRTSRSSTQPGAARSGPPTFTKPTTPLGRATTSSPGR